MAVLTRQRLVRRAVASARAQSARAALTPAPPDGSARAAVAPARTAPEGAPRTPDGAPSPGSPPEGTPGPDGSDR